VRLHAGRRYRNLLFGEHPYSALGGLSRSVSAHCINSFSDIKFRMRSHLILRAREWLERQVRMRTRELRRQ